MDFLAALLPGNDPSRRHEDALAAFACMIGSLILAWAVDDGPFSDKILEAGAKRIIRGERRGKMGNDAVAVIAAGNYIGAAMTRVRGRGLRGLSRAPARATRSPTARPDREPEAVA